jgi:hypothetical protein
MAKRVPSETRRLTRSEASRLGVSYGAKRRVSKSVKHVTRKTVLYTDRQVATSKLRVKTGNKKATRESAHKANVEERTLKNSGNKVIEFKNLDKANFHKMLRKYRDKVVMVHFKGGEAGQDYKGSRLGTGQWVSGHERILARELLDSANFDDYMDGSGVDEIKTFGLIVYL